MTTLDLPNAKFTGTFIACTVLNNATWNNTTYPDVTLNRGTSPCTEKQLNLAWFLLTTCTSADIGFASNTLYAGVLRQNLLFGHGLQFLYWYISQTTLYVALASNRIRHLPFSIDWLCRHFSSKLHCKILWKYRSFRAFVIIISYPISTAIWPIVQAIGSLKTSMKSQ